MKCFNPLAIILKERVQFPDSAAFWQAAAKHRSAAEAGRIASEERQRIERSEVIQSGVAAATQRLGSLEAGSRPNKSAKLPNEPRCDPRAAVST